MCVHSFILTKLKDQVNKSILINSKHLPGADPGFEKGGFNVVPKSDTGGATHNYL